MDNEKLELIESSKFYIVRLRQGIEEEIVRCGIGGMFNPDKAILVLDGLQELLKAFSLTSDYHTIDYGEAVQKASDVISELEVSLRDKDYNSIADIMKYEIIPTLELWQQNLTLDE